MAHDYFDSAPERATTFDATPASILSDTHRLIDATRKAQNEVVREVSCSEHATFSNTLLPLAHQANIFAAQSHKLRFYSDVSSDPALREASNEAAELLDEFLIDSAGREDLFHLIDTVYNSSEREKLDPESRLLLEQEHRKFTSSGLGIAAGHQRDIFVGMKKKLAQLCTDFQTNLNEEDGGLWFTLEELEGVPDDIIDRAEKRRGDDSKLLAVRLTFQAPDYFAVMNNAKRGETRKRMFLDNENKCAHMVPTLKEALVLRDEMARMLGYPNHATYRLAEKMISSPTVVNEFLTDLRTKLTARGREEITKLKKIKGSDVGADVFDGHFYLWDNRFYHAMLLRTEYAVDQQQISEFFELNATVAGMLRIFSTLFGLRFIKHEDQENTNGKVKVKDGLSWHQDVELYVIWDEETESGEFMGYLYMDLHPRPGKFSHMANMNIQPVCVIILNQNRSY